MKSQWLELTSDEGEGGTNPVALNMALATAIKPLSNGTTIYFGSFRWFVKESASEISKRMTEMSR